MKLSGNWRDFMDKLDQIHPRVGDNLQLPFTIDGGEDSGTGL